MSHLPQVGMLTVCRSPGGTQVMTSYVAVSFVLLVHTHDAAAAHDLLQYMLALHCGLSGMLLLRYVGWWAVDSLLRTKRPGAPPANVYRHYGRVEHQYVSTHGRGAEDPTSALATHRPRGRPGTREAGVACRRAS